MEKIIAIHQPNYFPWLGYFHKIYYADVFVAHDNVEYSKGDLCNRALLRKELHSDETRKLSVPLKNHSDFALIKDLVIDHSQDWQKKHCNILRSLYQGGDYFSKYFPEVEALIYSSQEVQYLTDYNLNIIKTVCSWLDVSTEIYRSSQLEVNGKKSHYNVNIVKHFKGTVYFSGLGAKEYQSEAEYADEKIKLLYQDLLPYLQKNPYPQKQGPTMHGLSILDALFNIGPKEIDKLLKNYA